MKFILELDCETDAFKRPDECYPAGAEVSSLLRVVALMVEFGRGHTAEIKIYDVNGSHVGKAQFVGD